MLIPFRAISVFHAVARAQSVSKAAAELGVTPSAVSQQIQLLETHLGTALLVKAGRRISLTDAGDRYFELIADGLDRVIEATGRLRGFRAVSVLTVRATPSLSTKWLLQRLPTFLKANPTVDLRLNATTEPTDFNREDVDVEIRHGQGRWPGLSIEGFAEEHFMPACAPSYAAVGSLVPSDLPRHRLIHSVKSQISWDRWFADAGVMPQDRCQRLLFDRSHMSIDAAASGLGIALESNLMMWQELCSGSLICPVASPPPILIVSQWIVCPREHLRRRKVGAFLDWLRCERDVWVRAAAERQTHALVTHAA